MSVRCAVDSGRSMNPLRLSLSQWSSQKKLWISVGLYYLLLTQILVPVMGHKKDTKSMSSSLQLQCPPCHQLYCTPKNPKRLSCKGGITTGICNCCPVCAKVEGEVCGGELDGFGKCDTGLVCEIQSSENILNEVLHPDYSSKESKVIRKAEGICKRVVHTFHEVLGDQPSSSNCRRKCTPEFCENNPRAICSAIDATENKQSCQGDCQHTTCRACHFVYETQPCGKCKKDDFKCLKQFGQCMRKQTCSRKTFPCKKSKAKSQPKEDAIFQCTVPECL